MNLMMVWALAREVFREALASKVIWMALLSVVAVVLVLMFALDVEVIDGALATSRLFGETTGTTVQAVDVAMRPVLQTIVTWVFMGGIFVGILATCEIVPRLLSVGRVERLLSLPIRRFEIVLGTYLGVIILGGLLALVAVLSCAGVIFVKARFFSVSPVLAVGCSVLAFLPIYAVMMAVGAVFRSASAAAIMGFVLFMLSFNRTNLMGLLPYIRSSFWRGALEALATPLPNLGSLLELAVGSVAGDHIVLASVAPTIGGVVVFAAAFVLLTTFVLESKDF